jgi:hypothetical protein
MRLTAANHLTIEILLTIRLTQEIKIQKINNKNNFFKILTD